MANAFKAEKDALCFLGLMSRMNKQFDAQIASPTGEPTHTKGLNIHALIVENSSGRVLGMNHNSIHEYNNPLLHAEQLTMKEAIEKMNTLHPRDAVTTSVEDYYRYFLFNDPDSYDSLTAGATIYTTLEPCPFCTSALLVSRMKRIVFITPDITYGNSFYPLWTSFYKAYDIHYEQMKLDKIPASRIVVNAASLFKGISDKVKGMAGPGTLYFDTLKADLQAVADYFVTVNETMLVTSGDDLNRNKQLLTDLKAML